VQQKQDENNDLVLNIDSVFDGREVKVNGQIGPFPELIVAGAIAFDFSLEGQNATAHAKGDVANLANLQDPRLDLQLSAPAIRPLLDILNLPEVTSGPVDLKGKFTSGNQKVSGQLQGIAGEFKVDGDLTADSLRPLLGAQASLESSGPSARALGNIAGLKGLPAEPYTLKMELRKNEHKLDIDHFSFTTAGASATGNAALPNYPDLEDIDLTLQVDAENIARFADLLPGDKVPPLPLSLQARISDIPGQPYDKLESKFRLGSTTASVNGTVKEASKLIGSKVRFDAALPDTMWLREALDLPILRSEKLSLSGDATIIQDGIRLAGTEGQLGQHNVRADGDLLFGSGDLSASMNAAVSGQDLANLVTLFVATDDVPDLPYKFAGELDFADRQLKLKPVKGTLGTNNLEATGVLKFATGLPDIDLDINANGPDLSELPGKFGITGLPVGGYTLGGLFSLSKSGIEFSKIKLTAADSIFEGSVSSGQPESATELRFDLRTKGKNLREFLPDIPKYVPAAEPFSVTTRGSLSKEQVEIERFNATVGTATIVLAGTVDLPPEVQMTGLSLKASGPDLRDIGAFNDWQFAEIPFAVSATMQGNADTLQISDLQATAGPSDLQGKLKLDLQGRPQFEAILTSKILNVVALQERLADEPTSTAGSPAGQPAAAANSSKDKDKRLIPNWDIPTDSLAAIDGSLQLKVGKLMSRRTDLKEVDLKASLQNGILDISRFAAATGNGDLNGSLRLTPRQDTNDIEASLTAKRLIFAIDRLDDYLRQTGTGQDVDLYLKASGNNLREIAAGLNGYLWLRGGERKISTTDFGIVFGDFLTEVISAVNPFVKKEPYQTLECSRLFFEATDGKLKTAPVVLLRTDKLNMTAAGTINLSNEKLNVSIETTPRTGIGLSASDLLNPFVSIQGTLNKPYLMLDPANALIQGGAAVATMGMSVVAKSMYKRWLSPRNPCEKLTEDARKLLEKSYPDHPPAD